MSDLARLTIFILGLTQCGFFLSKLVSWSNWKSLTVTFAFAATFILIHYLSFPHFRTSLILAAIVSICLFFAPMLQSEHDGKTQHLLSRFAQCEAVLGLIVFTLAFVSFFFGIK